MVVETWVVTLLKVVFVIVAGHIAITKIVPLLDEFLSGFIKNEKAVDSFTSLIDIFILVLVGTKIIEFLLETENPVLSYFSALQPSFELLNALFSYLQWILLALIAIVALKYFKS